MIDNFETQSSCPLCQADMAIKWQKDTIPYFGDIMYTTATCDQCTFKFADTIILSSKDPVCYSLQIKTGADLDARFIRSTSGTIVIEELGIMVEPGPISESYVTNVEGVLQRIRGVIESTVRWSEMDGDFEKVDIALDLINKIDAVIDNPETAPAALTLQIKDPLGNSAIISANAESRKLNEEELENLKTGMIILDAEKDEIIYDISDEAGPIGKNE
ncbi:ZPR1 zinc finger domain-containing protein [Methanimicrococcus blatticola]|nr:ZPR1 zinc finger domain-containing protein [Methanimicrococcus blatticola]MCC2509395.1 ZPR1 zinc finger domain-containing protein [Methanimicrococcus blatticola]